MKIIVWIEFSHGKVKSASLEALGSARTLAESASGDVIAVLCGPAPGFKVHATANYIDDLSHQFLWRQICLRQ